MLDYFMGETSNYLEVKHPREHNKANSKESDESFNDYLFELFKLLTHFTIQTIYMWMLKLAFVSAPHTTPYSCKLMFYISAKLYWISSLVQWETIYPAMLLST